MEEKRIYDKLKQRFCRDMNVSISVLQEPYFMDRLKLYDNMYNTLSSWYTFIKYVNTFKHTEEFMEDYNNLKETIIQNIRNSEGYKRLNAEDMNKYAIKNERLPGKDIFKDSNHLREFIGIDMKQANFSALREYDKDIFNGAPSWEAYMSKFTRCEHYLKSKYLRQVIFGTCNSKRHITYEKYLMDNIIEHLKDIIDTTRITNFTADEVIYDVTDLRIQEQQVLLKKIQQKISGNTIPLRIEHYKLHKIQGIDGYYKEMYNGDKRIILKGIDNNMIPFVLRKLNGEEIQENDKVFYYNGILAKFIDIPNIEI